MNDHPDVSVIIPTHNRSAALRRSLDALQGQVYPPQHIDVIVIADGCTDDTTRVLGHYAASLSLRVLEQPNMGPAAARNAGAACAHGEILVFIDDDVEVIPSFIAAHVREHIRRPDCVAIGYLPPLVQEPADFFQIELRGWWEAMFRSMRQSGHRFSYQDLLTGNFSLEADWFRRVGGFNPTLRCHEDYEFGVRLLKAGVDLTFVEDALGYHHEVTDLGSSLRRKYQEGQADVQIERLHLGLAATMPLAYYDEPWSPLCRKMRRLAFRRPDVGDRLAAGLQRYLAVLEWLRLRGRWNKLLNALLDYWYWRGVADALGERETLAQFLGDQPSQVVREPEEMEVDLSEGFAAIKRRLDTERPASLRIRYGTHLVGCLPNRPGAERLRAAHLQRALATEFAWSFYTALRLDTLTGRPSSLISQTKTVPSSEVIEL